MFLKTGLKHSISRIALLFVFSSIFVACESYTPREYKRSIDVNLLKQNEIEKLIENKEYEKVIYIVNSLQQTNTKFYQLNYGFLSSAEKKSVDALKKIYDTYIKNPDTYKDAISVAQSLYAYEEEPRYLIRAYKLFIRHLIDDGNKPLVLASYCKYLYDLYTFSGLTEDFEQDKEFKELISEIEQKYPELVSFLASFLPDEFISDKGADKNNKHNIYDIASNVPVVYVENGLTNSNGVYVPDVRIGTAFFIDKAGHMLTNYHVIEPVVNPKNKNVASLYIRLSDDESVKIPAKVVGYDSFFDIALLKTEYSPEFWFKIAPREDLSPGESVYAIGSPGGLSSTVTSGIISALHRSFMEMGDLIQLDAPINPGNSGGPVIDESATAIGVVNSGIEQFEGVNFFIPAYWLPYLLPDLYDGGKVSHPWLGLSLYESPGQVSVVSVLPDSYANDWGVQKGDIIYRINGIRVKSIKDMQKLLLPLNPGALVRVELDRKNAIYTALLITGEREKDYLEKMVEYLSIEDICSIFLGMDVEKISDKEYLVSRIYGGGFADSSSFSVNDSFVIKSMKIIEDKNGSKYITLVLITKRIKDAYLESYLGVTIPLVSGNMF